ncbi:MAG TPA: hypothetical protein VIK08_05565 [Candidatus Limnocylindrales bacterium]
MDQTLDRPGVLKAVTFTHEYAFSMKRLAWWTLMITAVMGALYFLVGVPPALDNYFAKMYFHTIGIGLAALAAYLVIDTFDLESYEPPLDFPIRYRAFLSVVFGALGGLLFLNRDVFTSFPDVGVVLLVVAFVLIFDVAGALLVELIVLPRKKAGVYDTRSRSLVDYVGRLIPFRAVDRAAYRGVGSGYWLAVVSIASACVAMIIGFINLWVRAFGPSFFGGYMGWLGLDAKGFQDATLDPHSHMVALAIVGLVVALATVRFGVLDKGSAARRMMTRIGVAIAFVGVILTSLILGAVAFFNYQPPTLFTSGPDGVNGMAGDDLIMTIVFVGAMVVAAVVLTERRPWRDPLRLTVVGAWVATFAITVLQGFYIELNQDQFGGTLAANDANFAAAHPITGIFLMLILSVALLLVDVYCATGMMRRIAVAVGAIGLLAAAFGTTLWTFVDPSTSGLPYYLYIAGIAISFLAIVIAALAVRTVPAEAFDRTRP